MKPLDYTLYNKVKEKFPPQPRTIVFVSLAPENLDKLEGTVFTEENVADLEMLISQYGKEAIPFATIDGFEADEVRYNFYCNEFEQEENLLTGKIVYFAIDTYNNRPPDIEALRRDMKNFSNGTLLSGNA